jgi:hypothetical protein
LLAFTERHLFEQLYPVLYISIEANNIV